MADSICGTGLTLNEYREAVRNGGLDWVCGPCLGQENEQPANNHDEVISFLLLFPIPIFN